MCFECHEKKRKKKSEQEREGGVHILTIREEEEEVFRLVLNVTIENKSLNKNEKMVFTY